MSDTVPSGEDSKAGMGKEQFELREQDKWLPIANVSRIMKNALPPNAKVSKEAKECVQECVSEFVSFITSEASEKCSAEKRKTVNGEDILFAMTSLGFENYSEVLKIYLTKYREFQVAKAEKEKRASVGGGNAIVSATESVKSEDEHYAKNDDSYTKAGGGSYNYDEAGDAEGEEAIYEEYSGQYTNVDMNQF